MEAGQVLLFTGGVSCGSAAVYVRLLLCGSIAAFYVWCTPDMRFRCGVVHLVHVRYTALLRCFVFGVRPICGSVAAFCIRSRLLFAACAPNRTACGMLRFYSAGSRSPFARSRDVGAVICLCGNAELVCAAMRFLSPRLPSVYARRCGSIAAFCVRSRLLFVF